MADDMDALRETLVWQQFRRGDMEAFAALFEETADRLFCYGMKFTNDRELVKDAVQDVFVKLYQTREKLPDVGKPVFYLFKILKNTLIDAMRKREKTVYMEDGGLPFYVEFALDGDCDAGAAEDYEKKEKFDKVIALLTGRQKEAVYLRFHAGLSYDEIAELLGINGQSARNLVHRVMEKVRREMDSGAFIVCFLYALR
ncbi:MAG: RNA polymerase sigma factor [Tannerellaceae bacterium]|nr:RNA polymerase sigma factor [Tannerellaceae bacterium]